MTPVTHIEGRAYPFGRSNAASTRPTGSGKRAIRSTERAIASIRPGSRSSRSMKDAARPDARRLLERGVATVRLFDGEQEVYGPMGLAAT